MADKRNLEPVVHDAVMRILSTIYETGLVSEVSIASLYRMFGVEVEEKDNEIIDFASSDWMKDYILFNKPEDEDFEMKLIDMETGDVTHKKVSKEELAEMLEGADEFSELPPEVAEFLEDLAESDEIISDDLDPGRTIH